MTIVIPIGQKRFYYNRKINCMPAAGYIQYGDWHEELAPDRCLGSLDWGRGVWEYRSFWNWASASGFLPDGRRIGLNLGCGFGDLSRATENCLILDGRIHKLGQVRFDYHSGELHEALAVHRRRKPPGLDLHPLQRPHRANQSGHHLQRGAPDVWEICRQCRSWTMDRLWK